MKKNTIEAIQANSILKLFIAEITHGNVDRLCRVIALEKSDSAYYKFCEIMIDTVLARE